MKKLITLILAGVMLLTCTALANEIIEAKYTDSSVEVNGKVVAFEAYNIKDNNYFKLRDVAMAVKGSEKQFEVVWNEQAGAVEMLSNKAYTIVGGELAQGDGANKTAETSTSKFYKDGGEVKVTAYLINGNNYIKLRDLGKLFDFEIEWDGENNRIVVDTKRSYTDVDSEKKAIPFYEGYPDVVDLGALFGISPTRTEKIEAGEDGNIMEYTYNRNEVGAEGAKLYVDALLECGFIPVVLGTDKTLFFNTEGRAVLILEINEFLSVNVYETRLLEEAVYEYLLIAAQQMMEAE